MLLSFQVNLPVLPTVEEVVSRSINFQFVSLWAHIETNSCFSFSSRACETCSAAVAGVAGDLKGEQRSVHFPVQLQHESPPMKLCF